MPRAGRNRDALPREPNRGFCWQVLTAGRYTSRRLDSQRALDGDEKLLSMWTIHSIYSMEHRRGLLVTLAEMRLIRMVRRNQKRLARRAEDPVLRRRTERELIYAWKKRNPGLELPTDEVIYTVSDYTPEHVHAALWMLREEYYLFGERSSSVWGRQVIHGVLCTPRYVYDLIVDRERSWNLPWMPLGTEPEIPVGPWIRKPSAEVIEILSAIWDPDPEAPLHDLCEALSAAGALT